MKYNKFNIIMIVEAFIIVVTIAYTSYNVCSYMFGHESVCVIKIIAGIILIIFMVAMEYHSWIYRKE